MAKKRWRRLDNDPHFDISTFIEILEQAMQSESVIRALAALAQDHRLAAFRLLVQAGEDGVAAGVLAEKLDVPPSSMSFHLAQLANAGLVTQRRESRSIIYSADYAAMNLLMGYLTENCCGGLPCSESTTCPPATNLPSPNPSSPERKSA
jgi:DNA-binding transcriptional ArsR family regulator